MSDPFCCRGPKWPLHYRNQDRIVPRLTKSLECGCGLAPALSASIPIEAQVEEKESQTGKLLLGKTSNFLTHKLKYKSHPSARYYSLKIPEH
jgi:hypothetical protein